VALHVSIKYASDDAESRAADCSRGDDSKFWSINVRFGGEQRFRCELSAALVEILGWL